MLEDISLQKSVRNTPDLDPPVAKAVSLRCDFMLANDKQSSDIRRSR